jgi:hypothetical protein
MTCSFIDRVTKKAALSSRRVPIARWYLDERSLAISAFVMRRQINSQRGHEDLVYNKATKAKKYRVLTEANEGLLMLCVLGPGGPSLPSLPSVKNPSVFVAFL